MKACTSESRYLPHSIADHSCLQQTVEWSDHFITRPPCYIGGFQFLLEPIERRAKHVHVIEIKSNFSVRQADKIMCSSIIGFMTPLCQHVGSTQWTLACSRRNNVKLYYILQ